MSYSNNPALFGTLRRAFNTNSTQTAVGITNNSEYVSNEVNALNSRRFSTSRGIILFPFGSDAANETFTVDVYACFPIGRYGSSRKDVLSWVPTRIVRLVCTLGAKEGLVTGQGAGAGGGLIGEQLAGRLGQEEFYADTIAATTEGPFSALTGLYGGTAQTYSPANDTVAFYGISDIGTTEFAIDVWKNSQTAASANVLWAPLGG